MKWTVFILILNTAFLFSQEVKIDTLEDVEEELFENVEEDSQLDEIIESPWNRKNKIKIFNRINKRVLILNFPNKEKD